MILDEPTSSLDEGSELAIQNGLAALRDSVTVVVVSHRPSTLSMCDRVLIVDGKGGIHEELPAMEARFPGS